MNKKIQSKNKKKIKSISTITGFTLIEITISLSLFIVVMMVSTGALLSLSATNDKVSSMRTGMNNLNLALDSMSREIRMGTVYHCDYNFGVISDPRDCPSPFVGASSFTFLSQSGEQMVYLLNNNSIERSKDVDSNKPFFALTAPEIKIDYLKFIVLGAEKTLLLTEFDQPRVIILVRGTSGVKEKSQFSMQTMVTQKRLK